MLNVLIAVFRSEHLKLAVLFAKKKKKKKKKTNKSWEILKHSLKLPYFVQIMGYR